MNRPQLVVVSSLFPSEARPQAGIFVRERMFRVGRELPIAVVSPQPWFPGQALLRRRIPGYRLSGAASERNGDVDIWRPRFLALPGVARAWDGAAMALAAWPILRRLQSAGRCEVIDAHFAYPDGYAASLLGRWLGIPVCVTLRGTEPRHLADARLRPKLLAGLRGAARVFTVSDSLRRLAIDHGIPAAKLQVVGNGVDTQVFHPVPKLEARAQLALPAGAKVLITVGGLVERKGFHRVLEVLPELRREFPDLVYLIVGGPSPEGDWSGRLSQQAQSLGAHVRFLGPMAPAALKLPLSASDLFVLPSSNEGWANVILEAMACGLPVVASDVGGNAEVVADPALGCVYPFAERGALAGALGAALRRTWDPRRIVAYAAEHTWDRRVLALVEAFRAVAGIGAVGEPALAPPRAGK